MAMEIAMEIATEGILFDESLNFNKDTTVDYMANISSA